MPDYFMAAAYLQKDYEAMLGRYSDKGGRSYSDKGSGDLMGLLPLHRPTPGVTPVCIMSETVIPGDIVAVEDHVGRNATSDELAQVLGE